MLPHYHYGRDRTGHVVYYERPGLAKLDELRARGIGPDEMYRHWLFFVEYQYRILLSKYTYTVMMMIMIENSLYIHFIHRRHNDRE